MTNPQDALLDAWSALESASDTVPLESTDQDADLNRDLRLALRHIRLAQRRLERHMEHMREQTSRR